jgi:hypothetical protein
MKIYWVETEDHDEDWFIVAATSQEAEIFHEGAEGYDPGDARANLVVPIPESLDAETGWPSDELLEACGGKWLRRETPRVVEFGGRRFCEGLLEHEICQLRDDVFESQGQGRPNKTERREKN